MLVTVGRVVVIITIKNKLQAGGSSRAEPGYHTWTTPAGRTYTTGPTTYPI